MLPYYDCACVDYNWIANCCQVILSASLKNRFLLIYSCTWLRCKISDDFFFSPVIVGPCRFHPVMHTELSVTNLPPPPRLEILNTSSLESLLSLLFCTSSFSTDNLYFHSLCSWPQAEFISVTSWSMISFKRFTTSLLCFSHCSFLYLSKCCRIMWHFLQDFL